jgi:hypothetical protein
VWLIEAALLAQGTDTSVLQTLLQTPTLFPFCIPQLYAADLKGQRRVEIFRQGLDEDMVALRAPSGTNG